MFLVQTLTVLTNRTLHSMELLPLNALSCYIIWFDFGQNYALVKTNLFTSIITLKIKCLSPAASFALIFLDTRLNHHFHTLHMQLFTQPQEVAYVTSCFKLHHSLAANVFLS